MNAIQLDEEGIFQVARRIQDAEARGAYLEQVCGQDRGLRDRLDALLLAYDQERSFLDEPPAGPGAEPTAEVPPLDEGPGTVIGPYKLLEAIGEGGMGIVYMAEQTRPVRRKVALKIIKPGMDTRQVVARFEAERQALALMDHPNIARVLDAGSTEGGHPYFVKELVKGIPITDYCDRNRLAIEERLELFAQVGQAVQHAHQKGIIHRDLKPSNVLVTMIDGAAVPKIIDFGVAKAMGQQLTERTLFTGFAQLVGTPLYMSPEQAEFSGVDVDTRSDIYSLGVLLYELLTGTTPFDAATFRTAAYDEIRRIIREQEPPKPSTRISSLDATATTISTNRRSDPRSLGRLMRGELDWIVMKALEKDRNRRYETANALVGDVRRHLNHEPVEAGPPSTWYRLRKAARRNRAALVTGAVVASALVAGTAVSTWAAIRAIRAEKLAEARLDGERTALNEVTRERNQANLARAAADQSAAEARAIVAFVVNDMLAAAAPSKTRGKAVTVLEALDNADRSLEGRFAKEPRVEAAVRVALAGIYNELGEYEKAEGHAVRALSLREEHLGREHELTLRAMDSLGWIYYRLEKHEKYQQAESLCRRMLEICRTTRSEEDDLTLRSMSVLGSILARRGKFEEAATLQQRVLDVQRRTRGPDDPATFMAMNNLAHDYMELGKLKEAEPLLRELVQARIRTHPDHPDTLLWMSNYESLVFRLGRIQEASEWAMRSMEAHLRVLKLKHPWTIYAIRAAVSRKTIGLKLQDALGIADRALVQARSEFGMDDPKTSEFLMMRVGVLYFMGDLAKAGAGADELVAGRTRKLGPDDLATLDALELLAVIRRQQGAVAEARTALARLRDAAEQALDSGKTKPMDPGRALSLRQQIAFATLVGRNLGRAERSDVAPGKPGGPPRIEAPFRSVSPVADGRIDPGEYGDGFAFDFVDDRNPGRLLIFDEKTPTTKDPSDLSARMHAAHTATALFLAFRVRDQSVRADPVATHAPWLNDAVEVYLDGDWVPNDNKYLLDVQGNREGLQILADVLGNRFSNLRPIGTIPFKVGTSRTDDGYIIEFEIPLDQIDTQDGPGFRAATTGSEIFMNVGIGDVDEAVTKMTCYGILWTEDPLTSPTFGGEDYWPVALRLVPAPAGP
jgi:serine/threonine protein kinase/tetratricopeptide (TPR) repeat protein